METIEHEPSRDDSEVELTDLQSHSEDQHAEPERLISPQTASEPVKRIDTRHERIWLNWRFVVAIAMLMTGCVTTTSPGMPSHVTATPTVYSWQTLQQRLLHLPSLQVGAPCPTTHGHRVIPELGFLLGNGPVYAHFFGSGPNGNEIGVLKYADAQSFGGGGSHWGGQKVIFFINPNYRGPVLIRGRQLDGPGMIRFNGTNDPPLVPDQALLTELRLTADVGGAPWPSGGSYTRLQVPGCYTYQVDGLGFSYLIIFKAVAIHIPLPKP